MVEKNKEDVSFKEDKVNSLSKGNSLTEKSDNDSTSLDINDKNRKDENLKKEIEKQVENKEEKKKDKKERIGILNIYTSFNNTIMNLTDMSGKSIAKFSGGQSTKQDRLKANPTIAMFIAQKIAEEAKDNGISGFYVKIRAKTGQSNPGPGTHSAIKSLTRAGFKILSIMDMTRIPRGGPKKKGGRRGRRV